MDQDQKSEKLPTLNTRQRMFVKGIAEGLNQSEAARRAGYSEHTAHVTGCVLMKDQRVQHALQRALEETGLNDMYLAQKVKELVEAESTDEKGNVNPNWAARSRGVDILCRLKGAYKDTTIHAELTFEQRLAQLDIRYREGDTQDVEL